MFQHIEAVIMGERIEACFRLKKQSDRTIVKFSRRKDCEHVMRKKSELRKLKPSDLDLPNGKMLYINESLCPYYRGLLNRCRKLWKKQGIFSFFTVNGSVRIKVRENGPYHIIIITHWWFQRFFPWRRFYDVIIIHLFLVRDSCQAVPCKKLYLWFFLFRNEMFYWPFSRGSLSLSNYYAWALLRDNFFIANLLMPVSAY